MRSACDPVCSDHRSSAHIRPWPRRKMLLLLLFCSITITCSLTTDKRPKSPGYHQILDHGDLSEPGVKIRLYQKALNHLNQMAIKVMNDQIPKIPISDIHHDMGPEGVIKLKDINVISFEAGKSVVELERPQKIVWSMKGLRSKFSGDLRGVYNLVLSVPLKGRLHVTAKDVDMRVTADLWLFDGRPHLNSTECKVGVYEMEKFLEDGGLASDAVNGFYEREAGEIIKIIMKIKFCSIMQQFINRDLNALKQKLPFKLPLSEIDSLFDREGEKKDWHPFPGDILNLGDLIKSEDLWLDYTLQGQPEVSEKFIETQHRGEVSWHGEGGTPFSSTSIQQPKSSSKQMIELYLSDFVANSFLYHAYKQGMLLFRINPETEIVGNLMKTTCLDGFCLGDLIPGLSETFPDHSAELFVAATRAPLILFVEENGGLIHADLKGSVLVFVKKQNRSRKLVLVMDVNSKVLADAHIEKSRKLKAKFSFEQLTLDVRRTKLKALNNRKAVNEFEQLTSELLEVMVNSALGQGLPVPLIDGIELDELKMDIFKRTMRLRTDFEVNEALVRKLIHEMMPGYLSS